MEYALGAGATLYGDKHGKLVLPANELLITSLLGELTS